MLARLAAEGADQDRLAVVAAMHARPCHGSERRWLRRAVGVTRIGGAGPLTDPGKTLTKSRQPEAFAVAEILAALNAVSRPEIRHKGHGAARTL
jgi:hypothetical protein